MSTCPEPAAGESDGYDGSLYDREAAAPVTKDDIARRAGFYALLGIPVRLEILYLLEDGPKRISELIKAVDIPHSNMSYHIGVLKDHGIVSSTGRHNRTISLTVSGKAVMHMDHIMQLNITRRERIERLEVINRTLEAARGASPTKPHDD